MLEKSVRLGTRRSKPGEEKKKNRKKRITVNRKIKNKIQNKPYQSTLSNRSKVLIPSQAVRSKPQKLASPRVPIPHISWWKECQEAK